MFTVRLLSIGAMILLAGCAHGPVDESADFAPVNYRDVCLLENSAVRSTRLVDAIESGFRAAGARVVRQPAGAGPDACPFTVTYEATVEGNVVRSIFYQTFEHGIPRREARGTAPKGRALTVSAVESYSKELIERLAAGAAPKDKKEPAAFMKRPNWAE